MFNSIKDQEVVLETEEQGLMDKFYSIHIEDTKLKR